LINTITCILFVKRAAHNNTFFILILYYLQLLSFYITCCSLLLQMIHPRLTSSPLLTVNSDGWPPLLATMLQPPPPWPFSPLNEPCELATSLPLHLPFVVAVHPRWKIAINFFKYYTCRFFHVFLLRNTIPIHDSSKICIRFIIFVTCFLARQSPSQAALSDNLGGNRLVLFRP
jgi:hypothetical protein